MTKILILEDEEVLGSLYKKHLEKAGFNVRWVTDSNEMLRMSEEFEPDIVFIDHGLKLENTSGLQLITPVRERVPDAKLIMLSNFANTDIRRKSIELGAVDYLVKLNCSPKDLAEYVEKLL